MLENKGLAESAKTGGRAEGAIEVQPGSVLWEWKGETHKDTCIWSGNPGRK